jgi:hypothetical protein
MADRVTLGVRQTLAEAVGVARAGVPVPDGVDPTEGVIVPDTLLVTVGVFVTVDETVLSALGEPVAVSVDVRVLVIVGLTDAVPVSVAVGV